MQMMAVNTLQLGRFPKENAFMNKATVVLAFLICACACVAQDMGSTPSVVLTGHKGEVLSVAFSSDGTQLLTGSKDKTAILWNAQTGELIKNVTGHKHRIQSVAFSPTDATRILTGSWDKTAKLWAIDAGDVIHVSDVTGHTDRVNCVAFSPDGTRIITGSKDKTARLWDIIAGDPVTVTDSLTINGHRGSVNAVAFSRDGTNILTGSSDETARLWDANDGTLIRTFSGHQGPIDAVALSPDGTRILAGGRDRTATIWNAATGDVVRTLTGHRGTITSMAFSPDGTKILTGSKDNTVRVWSPSTGIEILQLDAPDDINGVAFSPDGNKVAAAVSDKTARVWDISGLNTAVVIGGGVHTGIPGDTVRVPILVEGVLEASAIVLDVTFDPRFLEWQEESGLSQDETLLAGWAFAEAVSLVTDTALATNSLRIAAVALSAAPAVTTQGTLAVLSFEIMDVGSCTSTVLGIVNPADGISGATVVPITITVNGLGDVNGDHRITVDDATEAFFIALFGGPTTDQLEAADANGDGRVTPGDAQLIFESVLGGIALTCDSADTARSKVSTDAQTSVTTLTVGNVTADPGRRVLVPIEIAPGVPVTAFGFDVRYDSDLMAFQGITAENALTEDFPLLDAAGLEPGRVRVSGAALDTGPVTTGGTLVNLVLVTAENAVGSSDIRVDHTVDDISNAAVENGRAIIGRTDVREWIAH